MAYGTIKVDNITFDNGGVDKLITVSGLFYSTSGALTVTGTISGGNVTAPTATFTTLTGTTTAGTTATFTSGSFTSLTGVTATISSGIFAAGSATAPSVAVGTGTTYKPGIYSPGTDQLAISTAGVGQLFVDASGKVGIGTTPNYNLHTTETVAVTSAASYSIFLGQGTRADLVLKATSSNNDQQRQVIRSNSDSLIFGTENAAVSVFTEKLRIDSSGRVGIGTSSPSVRLQVQDSIAGGSGGTVATLHNASDTGGDTRYSGLNFVIGSDNGTSAIRAFRTNSASNFETNLTFWTNPTGATQTPVQRMTLDSTGRLGIGTTSPGAPLDVVGSSNTVVLSSNATDATTKEAKIQCRHYTNSEENVMLLYGFSTSTANELYIGGGSSSQNTLTSIVFSTSANNTTTSGTERARIDSSGRLLVGTSSARSNFFNGLNLAPAIQVEGTSGGRMLSVFSNNDDGGVLILGRQGGSTPGGNTLVANGNEVGLITFQASDGTDPVDCARIQAIIDGTPGANDMPGRLVFSTTADGAASPTERMRISSTGMCSINTSLAESTPFFDGKLRVANSGTGASFSTTGASAALVASQWHQATTGDNFFTAFGTEATFTQRGSITYNRAGGVVAYNTTSDYRSKSILGNIEDAGTTIDAFKVYRGLMNGATIERPMLIAHEAQEVAPYCVTGQKDAEDDNGNPIYQQMDHQVLIPLLIAEIQQLRIRVAALEGA